MVPTEADGLQVVQLLAQEGELTPEKVATRSWSIHIPVGVQEAIGRRLGLLSEGCNQVLTMASVIDREFELRLLERLEEDQFEGLLEPLAASRREVRNIGTVTDNIDTI